MPAPKSANKLSNIVPCDGNQEEGNGKVDTFWSLREQVDRIVGTEDISDACGHHSIWGCDPQAWRVLATAKKLRGLLKFSSHW